MSLFRREYPIKIPWYVSRWTYTARKIEFKRNVPTWLKQCISSSRHSKSNPIELNFNRTQSNSIELNRWIEFDWVRQSNEIELTEKKKNQSNPIERSIFELVIYVKQTLKIHYQILEARVTSALSVAHVFFVNEEIPQKWLQMRCGS